MTYRTWLTPMVFYLLARGSSGTGGVRGLLWLMAWTTVLVAVDVWREGIDRSSRGSIDAARVRGLMEQANSMGAFLVYYGVPLLALASARGRSGGLCRTSPGSSWSPGPPSSRSRARPTWRSPRARRRSSSSATRCSSSRGRRRRGGHGGLPLARSESVRERMDETTTQNEVYEGDGSAVTLDKSSAHRLVIWRGAGRMIAEHPFRASASVDSSG